MLALMHQLVPDLHFEYGHILVLGDHALVEWQDHGRTFRGEPFHNRGATVMRFVDGRVVEMRDHLDTEALAAFGSLGEGKRRVRA
jgi:ketosteroid isomerase-like protein